MSKLKNLALLRKEGTGRNEDFRRNPRRQGGIGKGGDGHLETSVCERKKRKEILKKGESAFSLSALENKRGKKNREELATGHSAYLDRLQVTR